MLALLARLGGSAPGPQAILAGSTGIFGASESIPALTDDVALAIDAEWLAANESAVRDALAALGFRQASGTCTFVSGST